MGLPSLIMQKMQKSQSFHKWGPKGGLTNFQCRKLKPHTLNHFNDGEGKYGC